MEIVLSKLKLTWMKSKFTNEEALLRISFKANEKRFSAKIQLPIEAYKQSSSYWINNGVTPILPSVISEMINTTAEQVAIEYFTKQLNP